MKLSSQLCVYMCSRSWCKNTSFWNSWSKTSEKPWHGGKRAQHGHCRCHLAGASILVPPSGPRSALFGPCLPFCPHTRPKLKKKKLCCQELHNCSHPPWGKEQVWRYPCPELIACLGTWPSWWPHVPTVNIRRAVCEEPAGGMSGGARLQRFAADETAPDDTPWGTEARQIHFCALLYTCLFLFPFLGIERESLGEDIGIRKTNLLRESTLWSPERERVWWEIREHTVWLSDVLAINPV